MIAATLVFLVETALGLFTFALLLRFYLQWARAPHRNPLSDFLHALTDFAVRPTRRLLPGMWGLDMATLGLAWLVQAVQMFIVLQLKGLQLDHGAAIGAVFLLAAVSVLKYLVYLVMVAVLVQALLSWVNPYSPAAPLLNSMSRPFLRWFQRRLKPIGNVDLSPLFVIVGCQLLLMLPIAYLEAAIARML